ncbi:class I SAM-dependent methyltransferase [Methylocapsa acidiphila]|uniref:class I SAM-dependent methyltransferase n=1 Tax=Methylocapsa acidiphila TaxID=133552 RepID=UPI000411A0C5|nr:ribose ABC transporter permease [Methylocapsa acidiphila]
MLSQSSRPDPRSASSPNIPIEERIADEARFFRSWLDNPMVAGAVSPSGRFLARMMARYVDPLVEGPIIELGPGTGPVTEALLRRGVAPDRLFLVEFDPGFCRLLARRFPGVHIIQGDAYRLAETLAGHIREPAAAIVSSLPLLMKPERERLALLGQGFALLAPAGRFVQFTYGPVSPIPRGRAKGPTFLVEGSPPVWLNLPPARVWIYRPQSQDAASQRQGSAETRQDFIGIMRSGAGHMQTHLMKEIEDAKVRFRLKARARHLRRQGVRLEPALRLLGRLPKRDKQRRPR